MVPVLIGILAAFPLIGTIGDANLDGVVDAYDMSIVSANQNMLTHQMTKLEAWQSGDFFADGKVDVWDMSLVQVYWGVELASATERNLCGLVKQCDLMGFDLAGKRTFIIITSMDD